MLVLLQPLSKIGVILSFKANQDYIAKVLCEKKDEPITVCGGKCYLVKELKKTEEKGNEKPVTLLAKLMQTAFFYIPEAPGTSPGIIVLPKRQLVAYNTALPSLLHTLGIFHPPRY